MDENTNTPNETSEAMDFSFLDVEDEKPENEVSENEAVETEIPEESNDNDTVDTSVEAEEEDTVDVPEEAPTVTDVSDIDTATTTTEEKEDDSPYAFLTMAAEEKAKEEDEEKPITDAATVTEMLTNQAMENAAKGNEYAQSAKTDATKETKAEEESKKGTFSDKLQESIDAIKQSIDMIKESGKGSSKEINDNNSFKDLIERNKEATNITETAEKALKGEVPYSLPEPKAEEVREIIDEDGKIKSIEKSEIITNKEDLRDMALSGDLYEKIEELKDTQDKLQEALKNAETDEEKNSIRSAMIGNNSAINQYQKAEKEAFEEEFNKDPAKAEAELRDLQDQLDEVTKKIDAGDMSAENVNAQSSLMRAINTYARVAEELFPDSTPKSEIPTDSDKTAEEFLAKSPEKEEEKPVTPPVEAPTVETPAPAPTPAAEDAETKAPETVVAPKMDSETAEEMTQALESLNTDDKANTSKVIEVISKFDPTLATFLDNAINTDWNAANIAAGNAYKQRGMEYGQKIREIWSDENKDRSFLGKLYDTVKETFKAGRDFKNITKNTPAYKIAKSAKDLTTRTLLTAIAAATGAPVGAVLIWGGSLTNAQLKKLAKNVTDDDFIADLYTIEEDAGAEGTVESAKRNYDEGLIQKWDKNDVSIDNSGYNKGLKEQETARKELPSDAFVKIIYKKEPWIRKFHV